MTVNMHEAKTNLSRLITLLDKGEEIVIAKAGNSVAKLISYTPDKKKRVPNLLKDKILFYEDFESSNQIYISSATIWEIAIKEALGKLKVEADLNSVIEVNGFIELKISAICANATKKLEPIDCDPFDRMLISQAIQGDMTLITVDRFIIQYEDVRVLSFR